MNGPDAGESTGQHKWILDFTENGKYPGVVMSQSRMREIELVVNPFSSMNHMNTVGMMSFGAGSWVGLLVRFILIRDNINRPFSRQLNPTNPVSPERYTALYVR